VQTTELGNRIRELRQQKGWSQGDLSNACHLPQATISRIESGAVQHPSTRSLTKIAEALGVPLDAIIRPRQLTLMELLSSFVEDKRGQKLIRVFSGVPNQARDEFERFADWIEQKYKGQKPEEAAKEESESTD
jgi:transcriptional regulator with XRE-family HTH domain